MSADCLFVLQKCTNPVELKHALSDYGKKENIGFWFDPHDGLLEYKQIALDNKTFLFEPTNGPDTIDSGLLLVPDYYSINEEMPNRPFQQRAKILQELGKIAIRFASSLEIYISEDNHYLPDYTIYNVTKDEIMDVLLFESAKDERRIEPIPCICIRVIGQ